MLARVVITVLSLILIPMLSMAGGKGFDCTDCREKYGSTEACTPVCGGKEFKGQIAKDFFKFLTDIGAQTRGEEGTFASLRNVDCTWKAGKKADKNLQCDFEKDTYLSCCCR